MRILLSISVLFLVCSATSTAQQGSPTDNGIAEYRNGEFERTIQILQEVVKKNRRDKLAWLYLGAAFVKQGKQKDAIEAFTKSGFDHKDSLGRFDREVNVKQKPRALYTDSARSNNVTGTVKVAVEYGADGKIGFIFPFQTLPEGLTQSAASAAKQIKFDPAISDGKPVPVVTVVSYNFYLY